MAVVTTLRAVLVGLVAVVVALGIGRWQGHREAKQDTASQLAAINGARLADLSRWQRDSLALAMAEREAGERYARLAAQRLDAQLVAARTQLDSSRAVLADTTASIETMHAVLTETTHRLALVSDMAASYRVRIDSLEHRHAEERRALMSGLAYADSLASHWEAEAARVAKARTCRIGFFPCPTRTQSAVIGAGLMFIASARARR